MTFSVTDSVKMFEEDPEKRNMQLAVSAEITTEQATVSAGDFSWNADFPPPLGGENRSPSPIAYFLGSLASCAVLLIQNIIATEYDLKIEKVNALITGNIDVLGLFGKASAELKNVNLNVKITTKESGKDIKRLMDEFKKRCPVFLTFSNKVKTNVNYEVE